MASGMGMPSIGIYSYELYEFYDVENIIRVGSAGMIDRGLKIRSVVAAMSAYSNSAYGNDLGFNGVLAPCADFGMLCQRLAGVYSRMNSLEELFVPGEPLEKGVLNLCREFEGVNGIPVAGSTSANKRLYMFLRWMVRKGSPVDFGIWNRIDPSQLLVPVDTHVYVVAKALGLTSRNSADLKTSVEITGEMAEIWPDDPARGDFALYGSQVM